MPNFQFLCLMGALLALNIQPAFAYIDVGSGSFFFQAFLAVILGSLAYVKVAWGRLKMMFQRAPKKEEDSK